MRYLLFAICVLALAAGTSEARGGRGLRRAVLGCNTVGVVPVTSALSTVSTVGVVGSLLSAPVVVDPLLGAGLFANDVYGVNGLLGVGSNFIGRGVGVGRGLRGVGRGLRGLARAGRYAGLGRGIGRGLRGIGRGGRGSGRAMGRAGGRGRR